MPHATYPETSGGQPSNVSLFGLAPGGVYHAFHVTMKAVSSYLAFSPLPRQRRGGMFSVALSLGLPPVRVTNHPALRSSDFPLAAGWQPATMHPLHTQIFFAAVSLKPVESSSMIRAAFSVAPGQFPAATPGEESSSPPEVFSSGT